MARWDLVSLLAAALAAPSTPLPAQARAPDARSRILVSVDWLARHRADPDLVLLHIGPPQAYQQEHIAGARQVTLNAITAARSQGGTGGLSVEFGPDSTLRRQLEDLGIGDGSRVVVVPAGEYVASAMRVLATLYYAGLGERASLLDGGLDAWKAAGHPVTADPPAVTRGTLTLRPVRDFVVDAEFVRTHAGRPGFAVVDARGQAFYDGVQNSTFARNDPGKPGHIPGALSLGMQDMYDEDGRLKPTEELRRLFTAAGVKPGDVVVGYCHIGIFANSVLTAARILGHEVRLYDGSFQDWVARGLPLEVPSGKDG